MTNRHAHLPLLTLVVTSACAPSPPAPAPRTTTVVEAAPPQSSPDERGSEGDAVICAEALSLTFGAGIHDADENRGLVHEGSSPHQSRLGAPIALATVHTPPVDALAARGFRLVAAVGVGTQTEPTATFVLLTTTPPGHATPDAAPGAWSLPLHRAVMRCVSGKGFELIGEPHDLGRGRITGLHGVQAVGGSFASIVLRIAPDGGAARTELLLFGKETPTSPWQLHDLTDALPAHDETLMGSGWYDFDGGHAYLLASRRNARVDLDVVATFTQSQLQKKRPELAWAIVGGPGALPNACSEDATLLDCAQLGTRQRARLSPEVTWIAGVWPNTSAARAARSTIDDPDVYWFAVGERRRPTPDPATQSLTQLAWGQAPNYPPPP